MTKLNQIIAVEKGIKAKVYGELTNLNKLVQKPDLFNGLTKTYERKDEDGEDLPSERKRVQYTVKDVLRQLEGQLSDLIQVTARKDFTNCVAKADVIVDGKVIIKDAPVSYLLFLEKTLTDVRTFFSNLPVLDEVESWSFDNQASLWKTDPIKTHRTKKTQKPIVLYDATPEHPAQTQLITEDVIVGYWNQIKLSGASSKENKEDLVRRTDTLLRAIKEARELANIQEETKVEDIAKSIFDYLL